MSWMQLLVRILNCFSECESLGDLGNHILVELVLLQNFFEAFPLLDCIITRLLEGIWSSADLLQCWFHWFASYGMMSAHRLGRLRGQMLNCLAQPVLHELARCHRVRTTRHCWWEIRGLETFRMATPPCSVSSLVCWFKAVTDNGRLRLLIGLTLRASDCLLTTWGCSVQDSSS